MKPGKRLSMIRSLHLADWLTLGNANCGVGAVFRGHAAPPRLAAARHHRRERRRERCHRQPSLVRDDPHWSVVTPPPRVDVRGFRLAHDQPDTAHSETLSAWLPRFDLSRTACGQRLSDGTAGLAGPGGFHELERRLKQLEILLVLSRIGAVDLYPFPRARHTAGLKRDDVAP
jgi:hypothetical protein